MDRILSRLPRDRVHQGTAHGQVVAAWIDGRNAKWSLKTADGKVHANWDKVIFAAHADETVKILTAGLGQGLGVGQEVLSVLFRFRFSTNLAVLHADTRLMPVRRSAWSAWNFLAETIAPSSSSSKAPNGTDAEVEINGKQVDSASCDVDRVSLTYWMNLLQSLPESTYGPILVTLNPTTSPNSPYTPRPELVLKRQAYTHPIYTPDSVLAQQQLRMLQGTRNAYFANYGFHEDGFSSGLRAADAIDGVYLPFDIKHAEREIPTHKQWTCRVTEHLDGLAKQRVVSATVQLVLVLACHALAVFEVLLVLSGCSNEWSEGVRRVKEYFSESVSAHKGRKKVK